MPFVIDLTQEIPKERYERIRNLVVQAIAADPRFAPQQRMSIISEVLDSLDRAKPKTYDDVIRTLGESIPRKKGYIPDAKRLVVEMLAKDAGAALDPASVQIKSGGNLYSLYNEPGQRTLRSGYIDRQSGADKLMEPIQRVLRGENLSVERSEITPERLRAESEVDEQLARKIREQLERRGVSIAESAAATTPPAPAARLATPAFSAPPQATLQSMFANRMAQPVTPIQTVQPTSIASTPLRMFGAASTPISASVPKIAPAPPTPTTPPTPPAAPPPAASQTSSTIGAQMAEAAEQSAFRSPNVSIKSAQSVTPNISSRLDQVKATVKDLIEEVRRGREGAPERLEQLVKRIMKKKIP